MDTAKHLLTSDVSKGWVAEFTYTCCPCQQYKAFKGQPTGQLQQQASHWLHLQVHNKQEIWLTLLTT
jgi:hypothetical protein